MAPTEPSESIFEVVTPDTMVLFLSFFTLALAGTVAASPLELGMVSNLRRRDFTIDCSDSRKGAGLTIAYEFT
jgi:hypothetical protein